MRDLTIAFILIFATVGLIILIRLLTPVFRNSCRGPRVELKVFFDKNCECLEYSLARIYSCPALRDSELSVTVADCIGTEESALWLETLRKKLKKDFIIVTEEESGGESEYRDHKRDG